MRTVFVLATTAAGLLLLGLMLGHSLAQPAYGTTSVNVLCNNMSANDGPDSPERDLTPAEYDQFCR